VHHAIVLRHAAPAFAAMEGSAPVCRADLLAEELSNRNAPVSDFFKAYVYSNTDNIQANAHYLDYSRLKDEHARQKKRKTDRWLRAPIAVIDCAILQATTTTTVTERATHSGWPIVGWATLVVVAIQLAVLAVAGTGEEGVRMAIRASARTSAVLFGLAFTASSLYRLAPGETTRWLLRNRRYLGVSFAVSHAIHLAAIVTLAVAFDVELATLTLVVGGFGYVLLAAMTATSFDRAVKWMGARRWSILHGFGARYLWLVFFLSYLPMPGETIRLLPTLFFLLVVSIPLVRTAAWWHARTGKTRVARAA
jgi:hypothetical protein